MASESTFGLSIPSTSTTQSETVIGKELVDFPSFLGFGIVTPFRREASDFASAGGVEHIQSMVSQVLGTRAGSDFTQGELLWRSDFGSLIEHLRHKNNTPIIQDLARVYVAEALSRWIPQIRLKKVEASKKEGPNGRETILLLRIVYDIIGVQQGGNNVLLSNVSQNLELLV